VADAFQRVTDFHTRWPDLPAVAAPAKAGKAPKPPSASKRPRAKAQ
jgi:hypothetical protein